LATESIEHRPSWCELDIMKKERAVDGPMVILTAQDAVDAFRLLHPTTNKVCIYQCRYTQMYASSVCVISYTVFPHVTDIEVMEFEIMKHDQKIYNTDHKYVLTAICEKRYNLFKYRMQNNDSVNRLAQL
jgi:hypothetical protein